MKYRNIPLLTALTIILALSGCQDIIAPKTSAVIGVIVVPAAVNLQKGSSHQFTAVVEGINNPSQTVTWSITSPHAAGTGITAAGLLTVAADEGETTLTIRAVSVQDITKSGTAGITVTDSAVTSTVTNVTIDQTDITLDQGEAYQFTATVLGTNGYNTDVDWSITSPCADGTTIAADGTLTVADDEDYTSLTIRAVSVQDSTKYDTAIVIITGGTITSTIISVTIDQTDITLDQGESYQFTATVLGTNGHNTDVDWSITSPCADGTTIAADGTLTVADDEDAATLTIMAVSVQDSTKDDTATVTITPSGGGATVTIIDAFETDKNLSLSYSGTVAEGTSQVITFTDNNSYGDTPSYTYAWYFNGDLQTGTANSITITTDGLSGLQFGLAVVSIDGAVYSKEFSFLVTD
ncbi:MAG: Ig-like domain-containing protein [Treponema sp.]|nr:Ig-like domain-containing protein [Treponema sp.]